MTNIAGKLVRIMEECSIVKKNGTNDFHHYRYATSADVLEKVNAALVKNKVASLVLPEVLDSGEVVTSKGNTEHLVTVKVGITLIDTESGETLEFVGLGSGQDAGDKAVMKAQTAAIKYAYLLSLAISANDDPEADRKTDESMGAPLPGPANASNGSICRDCGASITPGVQQVSVKRFGKALCMKCQKKAQGVA